MPQTQDHLDESEIRSFLFGLAFVREYSINLISVEPGAVTIELPFSERFSGPASVFPASLVGTVGDVAAVASCLSVVPKGWGVATLDFTITGGTGKFAGATGSGTATVLFAAYAPKKSNGTCNESNSAQPLANGAISTFSSSGPLTVKI